MGGSTISSMVAAATVLLLLSAAARRQGADATEYTVGDSDGWTIGLDYVTWSQKYNFTAGDTQVFDYVVALHNVYMVTEAGFRTCETANQTIRVWDSGRDLVNLTAPGDYHFVCNVTGHCFGGMKLAVAVVPPFPTTTTMPPAQPPLPASPSAQPRPPSPPIIMPALVPSPTPAILPAEPPLVTFTPSLPTLPTEPGLSSAFRWKEVAVWIPCLALAAISLLIT